MLKHRLSKFDTLFLFVSIYVVLVCSCIAFKPLCFYLYFRPCSDVKFKVVYLLRNTPLILKQKRKGIIMNSIYKIR